METLEDTYHRLGQNPRFASVKQHSLDDCFIEATHGVAVWGFSRQDASNLGPSFAGFGDVFADCGKIIIISRQDSSQVLEEVHVLNGDALDVEGHCSRLDLVFERSLFPFPFLACDTQSRPSVFGSSFGIDEHAAEIAFQ